MTRGRPIVPRGNGRRAARAAFCLLLFCPAMLVCPDTGFAWLSNFINPKSMMREAEQKKRDKEYVRKINKLEKGKSSEASGELFKIYHEYTGSRSVNGEALRAVGRMKRQEDVKKLIELNEKEDNRPERQSCCSYPLVTEALGEIGGPEACRYLTEYLRVRLKPPRYLVDVKPLVTAIQTAECLPQEELRSILWGYIRNVWTSYELHKTALQFLQDSGDSDAVALGKKYKEIGKEVYSGSGIATPIEKVTSYILDPTLPWWFKGGMMQSIRFYRNVPKEDLLDLCFAMAAKLYSEMPNLPLEKMEIKDWGTSMIGFEESRWGKSEGDEYFKNKLEHYHETLSSEAFKLMEELIDTFIKYFHEDRIRKEQKRRQPISVTKRTERIVEGQAVEPVSSSLVKVFPPGISDKPFPEPHFVGLGSRLGKVEVFIFDQELKWFGLGQADLFLATVMKKAAETTDASEKSELHMRALQIAALERQLSSEPSRRNISLLMPVPIDQDTKTGGLEWSPRTRGLNVAFETGQYSMVLFRIMDKTSVEFRLNQTIEPENKDQPAAYRFVINGLPAKTWVITEIGTSTATPTVYISQTGETVDRRFLLLPDESQREVPPTKDAGEAKTLERFLGARTAIRLYENESFEKADGPSGVEAFRAKLLQEIEETRPH